MNKKESLKDTARVLGSMYDAIEFVALTKKTWIHWNNIQACLYGMA